MKARIILFQDKNGRDCVVVGADPSLPFNDYLTPGATFISDTEHEVDLPKLFPFGGTLAVV